MVDACSSLGSAISGEQRHATTTVGEDAAGQPSCILGFSIPRFALQLVTAETIFKNSGPQASTVDVLKEVALGVYNKVRRIPRKSPRPECLQNASSVARGAQGGNAAAAASSVAVQANNAAASMPGLWKDCSGQRSSGNPNSMAMNSSNNHLWEGGWKPSMQTDLGTVISHPKKINSCLCCAFQTTMWLVILSPTFKYHFIFPPLYFTCVFFIASGPRNYMTLQC